MALLTIIIVWLWLVSMLYSTLILSVINGVLGLTWILVNIGLALKIKRGIRKRI